MLNKIYEKIFFKLKRELSWLKIVFLEVVQENYQSV